MIQKLMNRYSVLALLILGISFGAYYFWGKDRKSPEDKYLTVKVERGSIRRTVSSTGTLQAVITVQVGSQVSGRIQELHADFNSIVKKSQLLAVIDPANFEAQRERAQAQLATAEAAVKNAEANLVNRRAELNSAKANLEVANVTLKEAERQQKRSQGLFKDGLISERELDTAQANYDQSSARVLQAEAQVNQVEASIRSALSQQDQASASVKQARAELRMAEVNLRYTNIISPIDGVVVERNVDIGQTVAASFQAPILFLIANDLTKMQVIAQIDEADIGVISEKAKAEFAVDAFPGQAFHGQISEIRLSSKLPNTSTSTTSGGSGGGTASNVVVYNLIIDVDNPQLKLRPGMTANVNFTVASTDNVLKISNAALRYRPSDKNPEEIQKLMSSLAGEVSANTSRPPVQPETSPSGGSRNEGLTHREKGSQNLSPGSTPPTTPGQRKGRQGRPVGNLEGTAGSAPAVVGPTITNRYGIEPGMKIRFPQVDDAKPAPAMIWILDANWQPQPKRIKLGITNGRETGVSEGDLKEGDTVITGELNEQEGPQQQRAATPFRGPFGPAGGTAGGRRGGR